MGEQTKMIKAILIASLPIVALAEAEADPYIAYSGLRYGLGGYYGGLGYAGLGYGYGLGCGHGLVYCKRSADAEPEAKAEADPYYGYGYGHGYVYGKRSADAEPEAKADPYLLYSGLGYTG